MRPAQAYNRARQRGAWHNFQLHTAQQYKDGEDSIGYHRDRETGWAEGTGFATLAFGAERDFLVRHEEHTLSRCAQAQAGQGLPH